MVVVMTATTTLDHSTVAAEKDGFLLSMVSLAKVFLCCNYGKK